MKKFFEIISKSEKGDNSSATYSLGVRVKIGGKETVCSITDELSSYEAFESEINLLNNELEDLLKKVKSLTTAPEKHSTVDADAPPEEIWKILSTISDSALFSDSFNSLSEQKRRELADYILTKCNIFSGKGALFSSQYSHKTGLIE